MKLTKLCITLATACMMWTLTSCGSDEPAMGGGNTQVSPDDPIGTVAINLTKGKFDKDNALHFITTRPDYDGGIYVYADANNNLVIHSMLADEEGNICYAGTEKSLSDIRAIPEQAGWTNCTSAEIGYGYIVRFKITDIVTGLSYWEYGRVYIVGLSGTENAITGWAVKYQPNWTKSSTEIQPDKVVGIVSVNLPKGKFDKDNSIILQTSRPGYSGGVYVYADANNNLVVRPITDESEPEICFAGTFKSLAEIVEIPENPAWTHSTAVETARGYIVCYKVTADAEAQKPGARAEGDDEGEDVDNRDTAWEYSRLYVAGLAGSGNKITGWAVKYQPFWKTTPTRVD